MKSLNRKSGKGFAQSNLQQTLTPGKEKWAGDPFAEKKKGFGKFDRKKGVQSDPKGKDYHIWQDKNLFKEGDDSQKNLVQNVHAFMELTAPGKEMREGWSAAETARGRGIDRYYVYVDWDAHKDELSGITGGHSAGSTIYLRFDELAGEIMPTADDLLEIDDNPDMDRAEVMNDRYVEEIFEVAGKFYYLYSDDEFQGDVKVLGLEALKKSYQIWERSMRKGHDVAVIFVNTQHGLIESEPNDPFAVHDVAPMRQYMENPNDPWHLLNASLTLYHETWAHVYFPALQAQDPSRAEQHRVFHGQAGEGSPNLADGAPDSEQRKYLVKTLSLMGFTEQQIEQFFTRAKGKVDADAKKIFDEIWKSNVGKGQTGIFTVDSEGRISIRKTPLGGDK